MKPLYSLAVLVILSGNVLAQTATQPAGSGSAGDPWQIATLNNLYWVTQHPAYWSGSNANFKQTADIDASPTSGWSGGFTPIGSIANQFWGTYDGDGHTIFGLCVSQSGNSYNGMFGNCNVATIRNLALANASVSGWTYVGGLIGTCGNGTTITNCSYSGYVSGFQYIGGLIGYCSGSTITNCSSAGSVYASAAVPNYNDNVGGLAGNLYTSTARYCFSAATVHGEGSYIGGLVGESKFSSVITNCYSTGAVSGVWRDMYTYSVAVGGLVGQNYCAVINSYSTGAIGAGGFKGGFVGYNYSGGTQSSCYWDVEASGRSSDGTGGAAAGKSTAEMKQQSTFSGWDFTTTPIWKIDSNNNGYPYLAWQTFSAPVFQAAAVTFSDVTSSSMMITWAKGSGAQRAVFVKQGTSDAASPAAHTSYNANPAFGLGAQIGTSGWYCVYNGTGTSVTVTGLTAATSYIVHVCEYNYPGSELYATASATDNPRVQQTCAAAPATQANTITFSSIAPGGMTLGWTNGNGSQRAVFLKQGNSGTASPVNTTTYAFNTVMGLGAQIGTTGWYCVYNGTGSSVAVTGLSQYTEYIAQVCEYNGAPGAEGYSVAGAAGNPGVQRTAAAVPTVQAHGINFSTITYDGMTVKWAKGNGSKRAVFVRQGNSGTAVPVDGATYAANTAYGSGAQIGSSGWYCVYNGTDSSVVLTGLSPATEYIVQAFEYNGGAGTELYLASTADDNPRSGTTNSVSVPTVQANGITFSNVSSNAMTITWTKGDGEKRAVFVRQASGGTTTPSDRTIYTANTTVGSGTQIGSSGWYCVYNGSGTTVTIGGLQPLTSYSAQIFEYNGTPGNEKYAVSTAADNPKAQTTSAYVNYALMLDGINDYVQVPYTASLNPSTFTYELWARVEGGSGTFRSPLSNRYYDGAACKGVNFYATSDNCWSGWIGTGGGGWAGINGAAVEVGKWAHLAMTYDGATLCFYVNGTLQGSLATGFLPNPANPLRFGCIGDGLNYFFNGKVDEVRVWNVARDSTQIQSNMHRMLSNSETGLIGSWRFDEGTGSTATDLTTSGNNGPLNNITFDATSGWCLSTVPIGMGTSASVPAFASGTTSLGDITIATADAFDNSIELVCTKVPRVPNQIPAGYASVAGDRYWILNAFGDPGAYAASLTFNFGPGIIGSGGDAEPSDIILCRRPSTGDGAWTTVCGADLVNSAAGTVRFSNITSFGQLAIVQNPEAMPVELASFAARASGTRATLTWTTASEVNNYGFEIERRMAVPHASAAAQNSIWKKVGFVQGTGTSNASRCYSYTDAEVSAGTYAYRLKQINNGGEYHYSQEIEVRVAAPEEFGLSQNYPNPFNPSTMIAFTVPVTARATLKVMNALGQEVATLFNGQAEAGVLHQVEFDASRLASGVYVARLESNGSVQCRKIMLLK